MKVDSSDIDKQALHRLLQDQFGLVAAQLSFVPRGEESYGYMLETPAGSRYFVKVYEHPPELSVRYQAANTLHTRCGLRFVVYPHETRAGQFHASLDTYAVAVFDWIEGTVSDSSEYTDQEWQEAARLTAALHQSVHCPALPTLPVERFELWFEQWLSSVLNATEENRPLDSACERETKNLILREKDDILATLEGLKRLAERIRAIPFERMCTHGDWTPQNWIKDSAGNIHVVDWSKIAIAPAERDLVNLVGERFELFLEAYLSSFEQTPRLHPELFEFYGTLLTLWAVADYGSWVLLENADPAEKEHAWRELEQHLPVNHKRAGQIGPILDHVIGAG